MRGSESRLFSLDSLLLALGCILFGVSSVGPVLAATPGLPFVEDFADTNLRDDSATNANWSTQEQALILAWRARRLGAFGPGLSGSDITPDAHDTYSVALGDVDGDGDLDLVAGNYGPTNRLYLNNGTADPWAGVAGSDITADAHDTWSVDLGDVDGDGDLDLVAGNHGEANRLYLNNGTADPWAGVTGSDLTSDAHFTTSIRLGDVDGDGDLDLVAGNHWNQANRLYLNNGTADPWAGVTGSDVTTDAQLTLSVALGDVDGDGDLDLVAGNASANRLYLNNGTADPWLGVTGSNITADAHQTESVALGDVDADGDLDLVAGNYNNEPNRLYLNNGTADPWAGVTGSDVTADAQLTLSVALGDVDGDGDLDLVAGNENQANRLYLNNGTAAPWAGVTGSDITADPHRTYSVVLGDVDGDGDLDLVAGNDNQVNRLYLNNGTANPWNGVTGSDITTDAQLTLSVALGDVDGDGDLDLVAGNDGSTNRLYLNNGTANPWAGVTGSDITADVHYTQSVALGDVDGDGDLDLVAGNRVQTNRLYLNNGTADPWAGVTGSGVTADAHRTWSVVLGDVDGDGDLDLVAGNEYQANRLYLNNGTADPWAGVTGSDVTADAHDTWSVALGDVDGDGHLDLVAGNDNQRNRLYLNNGTANPWNGVAGSNITGDWHATRSVALGDVDGDGDLDLVAGNDRAHRNRLYPNNGTADPWAGVTGSNVTADAYNTLSVVLGDVDGDGDLDLVAGNDRAHRNRLYLNNGTANPWAGVTGSDITADAHYTASVVLGDVDGDGDLDLVAGNEYQANRLYLNNGTADPWAGVTGSDVTADAHDTWPVAMGDVDGDGDLDLVAGNDGTANRLYSNNGTADPWAGVTGSDITSDAHLTGSVALGDVDRDGDLDLVAGNSSSAEANRLYLNNGTADPWAGVNGSDITADGQSTFSVALGDVDRDGDLDLVVGNQGQANRLYLSNGTADPWDGVTGSDITADAHSTWSVVLGDVDGDGDLDLVAGNESQANRLYLNNGTADPWGGVTGSDITADAHDTRSVVLGDVDSDGDLDLVVGNLHQANRLYLNNGTTDPWAGVTGSDITTDAQSTYFVVLGDADTDGDLDLVAGNDGQANRLYLNNGTTDPWAGVEGWDLTADEHATRCVALGDADGDGDLDLVAGNDGQTNRMYRFLPFYDTGRGRAVSLEVDTESAPITNATLTAVSAMPTNTGADYWLSNNGGQHRFLVRSGERFIFPTSGSDLRWGADLWSLSPALTPAVDRIDIITETDSDGDGPPDIVDNCPDDPNPGQEDLDSDGHGAACDCNDGNGATYPGADEVNDGADNQCPGDDGYGLIDEIEGCGFRNPVDKDELSWTAQSGATSYEVARSADPQFASGCTMTTTSASYWIDTDPVAQGVCHHYLVRALAPHGGSWGADSSGERTGVCP